MADETTQNTQSNDSTTNQSESHTPPVDKPETGSEPKTESPQPEPKVIVSQDQAVLASDPPFDTTQVNDLEEETDESDQEDAEDERITTFKIMIESFKKAANRPGDNPKDFKESARLASQITKFLVENPRDELFDVYLDFVTSVKDDAAIWMKGSTTLSKPDEQQIGILWGLFYDLATKNSVAINNSVVITRLRSNSFVSYYTRKRNANDRAAEAAKADQISFG